MRRMSCELVVWNRSVQQDEELCEIHAEYSANASTEQEQRLGYVVKGWAWKLPELPFICKFSSALTMEVQQIPLCFEINN